jgi:hypothetical protein
MSVPVVVRIGGQLVALALDATRCLEVCFTQRVNQPMPRSEAVRGVRE